MSSCQGFLSGHPVAWRLKVKELQSMQLENWTKWPIDLNQSLDAFHDKYAVKETADEWLHKHDYQEAVVDDAYDIWMAK